MESRNKKAYHFIAGMPRSGTTLLNYILNRNEEVICLPEAKHVRDLLLLKAGNTELSEVVKQYSKYGNEAQVGLYLIHVKKILDLYEKYNATSVEELSFEIGKNFEFDGGSNEQLTTVIDKCPSYTLIMDKIGGKLSDSKILLLTRDYRAFCLSKMNKRNVKNNNIFRYTYIAYRWKHLAKAILNLKELFPERVMIVKYEDLVGDQREHFIQQICELFNVQYGSHMLAVEDKKVESKIDFKNLSERQSTKLTDLSKPINKSRINAWKSELSPSMIRQLECICEEVGEELGYHSSSDKGSIYKGWVKFKTLPYRVMNNYLIGRLKKKFDV